MHVHITCDSFKWFESVKQLQTITITKTLHVIHFKNSHLFVLMYLSFHQVHNVRYKMGPYDIFWIDLFFVKKF